MSVLKDGRYPVTLDKERHFKASLNVLAELDEKCGGIENLGELLSGKNKIANLRWITTLMLNEGADDGEPELTEKEVGKMIHPGNMADIQKALFSAFGVATAGTAELEKKEDDEKN